MLCIKKRDERTDRQKDGRTNNPEAICPSNFFEVGGIIMQKINLQRVSSPMSKYLEIWYTVFTLSIGTP